MINIQTIQNVSDCTPLYLPHSLYLKPLAKLNISVALPNNKMGKSISNLDIMDKLSAALKPDKFIVLKVSKSTVDVIRFEGELDERTHLRSAVSRLDGCSLKVSGFNESFRVRCSETKDEFPTRHDWDSFFRDASNMDEMKAGERPDTIHLTHLPIRWFCPRHAEHEDNVKPSESIFKRIFEKFGSVRCVDIPICDPYRSKMNADINGMRTFSFEQDVLFEAYVQFDEYVGFVRAMDEFRGMKLVRKFVDKTQAINVSVTFDKTKHLSDAQMQRRERVRKRLISKVQAEEEERDKLKKLEQEKLEHERQKEEQLKLAELEKQREREEKRKEKHLRKIQERGQVEISQKIRVEERKLMIAQRKLESIRILEQLFDRIKLKHIQKQAAGRKHYDVERNDLRDRLVEKYKTATERLLEEQKKKVHEIKSKTPLMGLLSKIKRSKSSDSGTDDESAAGKRNHGNADVGAAAATKGAIVPQAGAAAGATTMNPFKAVAALAAAGGANANAAAYSTEAASEWMKSLSMFPYVPSVFPGMSALYRPPNFGLSMNYRGYAPRRPRARGGRGRGRGNYDGQSGSYYNNYRHYNYDDDNYEEGSGNGNDGYYHKSSYSSRSRNRSPRSRSRRSSRSRSTRRSRSSRSSRSRSYYASKRSRSRRRNSNARDDVSRTRKSRSGGRYSKTPPRTNKKLVSTRRSTRSSTSSDRSRTHSRSRSRSRSHTPRRSRRSWSRRSKRRSRSGSSHRGVVLETDKLVRSAEEIKRSIEKGMQERMREEEREIKQDFRRRKHSSTNRFDVGPQSFGVAGAVHNDANGNGNSGESSIEANATQQTTPNSRQIAAEHVRSTEKKQQENRRDFSDKNEEEDDE